MSESVQVDPFKIIGITVRTTNEDGQAILDLGKLWNRFYSEKIITLIPNKSASDIYVVYTDYMTDHKGPYTTFIGCRVKTLDTIPEGLTGRQFSGGQYRKFLAKGKMPHAVIRRWQEIWVSDKEIRRRYTADFEVYGRRSRDPEHAEVEIFIATKG